MTIPDILNHIALILLSLLSNQSVEVKFLQLYAPASQIIKGLAVSVNPFIL